MANFHTAVLTEDGISLLAKAQAGETKIEFTKAATGDGVYAGGEVLSESIALKSQRQTFPINTISVINDATVYLKFVITNQQESGNLLAGYYVKEVGIFANDPDKGEILYSIATAVIDQWDYLPAYNELMPSTITMEFYTEVANAGTVYIQAGDGIYVLQEDFNQTVIQIYKDMGSGTTIADDHLIHIGRELAEFTWEELSTIAKAGTATENNIHVGDYKVLTLSYTDRDVTTEYPVRMQVAGINTYAAYAFKSGFPPHHIDWISVELYPRISAPWNDTYNNDNASVNMPYPYGSSLLRTFLGMILGDLPENISPLIVQKQTYMEEKYDDKIPTGLTTATGSNLYATDLLWVPTEFEITGTIACGSKRWSPVGQMQYPLFANGGIINRIKIKSSESINPESWWTMTIADNSANEAVCIGADGVINTKTIITNLCVPICFRL